VTDQDDLYLSQGRYIRLVALDQSRTEEGRLEGLPTIEGNRRRIDWLMSERRQRLASVAHILVPPIETPIPWHDERPYPFGTPSSLPAVTCVGRFQSREPARDRKADYSELVVIWFQDEFALPIAAPILDYLKAVDWEADATDLEY
jgi:hypothetical protein